MLTFVIMLMEENGETYDSCFLIYWLAPNYVTVSGFQGQKPICILFSVLPHLQTDHYPNKVIFCTCQFIIIQEHSDILSV